MYVVVSSTTHMSIRPTSAVVRAVTDTGAVGPLSNRLRAVLAVGMRSNPVVSTGVLYSDEPPDVDTPGYFGYDDDYTEPYAKDDPRWGGNFQWVMERVKENPYYFSLASKTFRKKKELALVAVAAKGTLLLDVSDAFKNDRDIVMAALKEFPEGYNYISDELKSDDEIIRLAFSGGSGSFIYDFLPDYLKQNRDYMRLAVKESPIMMRALPDSAKRDRQFVLELVELNPGITWYIKDIYTDEEFWMAAVKASVRNLRYIPMSIPRTGKLLLELVHTNGRVLDELIENVHTDWKMDIAELSNDPSFRLAAATAERNPSMKMMGAILHDLEAAIKVLVEEKVLVIETERMRTARMERLEKYQDVLEKLANVPVVVPNGPIDTKIEELTALLNNPKKSKDLFKYRMERDMGDMLEETPSAKRARVATETRALAAGLAMSRHPVK